jgi:hypothetical protein
MGCPPPGGRAAAHSADPGVENAVAPSASPPFFWLPRFSFFSFLIPPIPNGLAMQSRKAPLYDPWALSKKLGAEFIGVFLFSCVWAFKNAVAGDSSSADSAVPTGFIVGTALAVRANAPSYVDPR